MKKPAAAEPAFQVEREKDDESEERRDLGKLLDASKLKAAKPGKALPAAETGKPKVKKPEPTATGSSKTKKAKVAEAKDDVTKQGKKRAREKNSDAAEDGDGKKVRNTFARRPRPKEGAKPAVVAKWHGLGQIYDSQIGPLLYAPSKYEDFGVDSIYNLLFSEINP